jgi:formate--tetrahydrofolate ligase
MAAHYAETSGLLKLENPRHFRIVMYGIDPGSSAGRESADEAPPHAVAALRQPSLGPVFSVKGGGTGGGAASLEPAADINLHFTGDIPAITTAHNLLAALVDNAVFHGAPVPIESTRVRWPRALDMNDRFLRHVIVGLGGKAHGVPRESSFDITAASEVMAILALAENLKDLESRLGRIVVGHSPTGSPVRAVDLFAAPSMVALLKDALMPNLVQTREGGPAFVHAGPFGNIAHGCNSVLATRMALAYGEDVITEAGFGFDLGAEKSLDIKCRASGLWPRAVMLVVTLRALKHHGGSPPAHQADPDRDALLRGFEHLAKHLDSVATFGLPAVVCVDFTPGARKDLAAIHELGGTSLPVCMAKTHLSLSDEPTKLGRPRGFTLTVREVRLSAGAGFLVALTGDILTMPGLPREPAARRVAVHEDGHVTGLMQDE